MTVCAHVSFSQRPTWPPSAAVRQRSIADMTFIWPRLTWPALAWHHAAPWSRKIAATSSNGWDMAAMRSAGLCCHSLWLSWASYEAATAGQAGSRCRQTFSRWDVVRLPQMRFILVGGGALGGVISLRLFEVRLSLATRTPCAPPPYSAESSMGVIFKDATLPVAVPADVADYSRPNTDAGSTRQWARSIGLAAAVGIVYFLAARLSLLLLTKLDGVAVFWPASGVATGVLIALGPRARLPDAAGAMAATIVANLMGDRTLFSAVVFGLCNAGEALLTAWLIESYFGLGFNLGKLSHVLGILVCAIVATAVSGIGGTAGFLYFHSPNVPILAIWQHWFASDALGIITVAPLIIELASAARQPPSWRGSLEGVAALVALVILNGFVIFLPQRFWGTVVPVALLFPMLLWLAARCHPVFAATAAFISGLTIVLATTFSIGFFGDARLPISERILGAQASILAVSFCVFVLVALFAERRLHETALVASGTRLQEALTELRLLYENAPIGLAFLTPDCRYRQINRRLTEICGISIADHIGKSVRNTVPQVADQVQSIVQAILRTGEPITGIEVNGQRSDGSNAERVWITYWHPLKAKDGAILGINVVAEEITEQKRAKAALQLANESLEARTLELTNSLKELRAAQDRLVQTQKLASLGQLTAGIAHEIKNPLNFVNN